MKEKCWHHPKRDATHISNLGTQLDLDTPVCEKCAQSILVSKNQEPPINPNAKVIPLTEDKEVNQ